MFPLVIPTGHTRLLPPLRDKHIDSGFTSQLLSEVINHPSSKAVHINYLLFNIKVDSKRDPKTFYNASEISASQVLKKGVSDMKAHELLIDYGMKIRSEDIACAVRVLPHTKFQLLQLYRCKYDKTLAPGTDKDVEEAMKTRRRELLTAMKGTKEV